MCFVHNSNRTVRFIIIWKEIKTVSTFESALEIYGEIATRTECLPLKLYGIWLFYEQQQKSNRQTIDVYYTIRLNHETPVVRRSYNKIARIRHYYQITAKYSNIFFSCVSVLCLRIYFQCLKTLFFSILLQFFFSFSLSQICGNVFGYAWHMLKSSSVHVR